MVEPGSRPDRGWTSRICPSQPCGRTRVWSLILGCAAWSMQAVAALVKGHMVLSCFSSWQRYSLAVLQPDLAVPRQPSQSASLRRQETVRAGQERLWSGDLTVWTSCLRLSLQSRECQPASTAVCYRFREEYLVVHEIPLLAT